MLQPKPKRGRPKKISVSEQVVNFQNTGDASVLSSLDYMSALRHVRIDVCTKVSSFIFSLIKSKGQKREDGSLFCGKNDLNGLNLCGIPVSGVLVNGEDNDCVNFVLGDGINVNILSIQEKSSVYPLERLIDGFKTIGLETEIKTISYLRSSLCKSIEKNLTKMKKLNLYRVIPHIFSLKLSLNELFLGGKELTAIELNGSAIAINLKENNGNKHKIGINMVGSNAEAYPIDQIILLESLVKSKAENQKLFDEEDNNNDSDREEIVA